MISVGLKPTTSRTGICCSIQLSYETILIRFLSAGIAIPAHKWNIYECKVSDLIWNRQIFLPLFLKNSEEDDEKEMKKRWKREESGRWREKDGEKRLKTDDEWRKFAKNDTKIAQKDRKERKMLSFWEKFQEKACSLIFILYLCTVFKKTSLGNGTINFKKTSLGNGTV